MANRYAVPLFLLCLLCFFLSLHAQPEPVWTDNCISANSTSGTCLQCVEGFYLQYFLCLPCAPLCQCSSQYNYCQTCMTLSYKGTNYSLIPYLSQEYGRCFFCDQFMQYCIECNSTSYCTRCAGGFFPIQTSNSSGIEATCTGQCSTSCDICVNASICQQCMPGYFLDPLTKSCTGQCGPNCTECLTSNTCKNCTPGYFLNITANACQSCNISDCIQCSNTTYCNNCGPGFYAANGSCVSTGISNCVAYIGGAQQATGCQICQSGYFVLYSNCFPCVGCELCSLQFLCQSKCFANATPFNFACLVPEYLSEMMMLTQLIGAITVALIMLIE